MTDETEETQAMPSETTPEPSRATQPPDELPRANPLIDDEGFGGFMGHGGQADISDQTEEDGANPNATAQSD